MDVRLLHLLEGATRAEGLAVVIDVFRAFSTACCLTAQGVETYLAVAHVEDAFRLKAEHPDCVLIGERGGKKVPGFDHGNSPTEIEGVDFTHCTVVHTTSAGTRGLAAAAGSADAVITGSFLNATAILETIRSRNPAVVSLVCMGDDGRVRTPEDHLCGEYLRARLIGEACDFDAAARVIRASPSGQKFLDPVRPWFPPGDLDHCLCLDRFDFVLEVEAAGEGVFALKRIPAKYEG